MLTSCSENPRLFQFYNWFPITIIQYFIQTLYTKITSNKKCKHKVLEVLKAGQSSVMVLDTVSKSQHQLIY